MVIFLRNQLIFSSGVLFTYYGNIDATDPIGKTYLPEDKFKELNAFVDSLKLLKMTPIGLNSLSTDDYEILLSGGVRLFSLVVNHSHYI